MSHQAWAERYERFPYAFHGDPVPEIVDLLAQLPPHARILSLADGTGRNSLPLARAGHDVVAVEWIADAARSAATHAAEEGLPWTSVCADAVDAARDLPGPWDAVVSIWGHLGDGRDDVVAQQLCGTLTDHAIVLIVTSTRVESPEAIQRRWPSLTWTIQTGDDHRLIMTGRPTPPHPGQPAPHPAP